VRALRNGCHLGNGIRHQLLLLKTKAAWLPSIQIVRLALVHIDTAVYFLDLMSSSFSFVLHATIASMEYNPPNGLQGFLMRLRMFLGVVGLLNELAEGLFTANKNPRPNVLRARRDARVSREESIGIHYFLLSFFWGGHFICICCLFFILLLLPVRIRWKRTSATGITDNGALGGFTRGAGECALLTVFIH
jgi:hypothetical protein